MIGCERLLQITYPPSAEKESSFHIAITGIGDSGSPKTRFHSVLTDYGVIAGVR